MQLGPGQTLDTVAYTLTGPNNFTKTGTLDVSHSTTVSGTIGGMPAGNGFTISLNGTTTNGGTNCLGSAMFNVTARQTTMVSVHLTCHEAPTTGSVSVNGTLNICPQIDSLSASPAEVIVGSSMALSASGHDTDAGPSPLVVRVDRDLGHLRQCRRGVDQLHLHHGRGRHADAGALRR